MKFCIIFTNNDNEEYTLKYKVYNTPIAVKWYESLCKQVLNKDNKVSFFSDFGQLDYVKIVSYEIESGN